MKRHILFSTILIAMAFGLMLVAFSGGCEKESQAPVPSGTAPEVTTPAATTEHPAATTEHPAAIAYVNATCPIMGSKLDPAKVTTDLTRRHKDKTVAFCCAGCPVAWDKLSDSEKDATLAKVTATE